jgi:hypothetical protein
MKKNEFEALLKIQGRYLLMCTVHRQMHDRVELLHAADVVDAHERIVMDGDPAKTSAAAIKKSIAKYFKQNANH